MRFRRIFRIDPYAPMLLGFNSAAEFWICVMPAAAAGLYGIVTQDLKWVLYGGGWFFAGYALFIVLDQIKKFLYRIRRR